MGLKSLVSHNRKNVLRGTKKDSMPTMTRKDRVVPSTRIEDRLLTDEKPIRLYTLEKQSPYLWNVLEVTVQHNKVVFVSRDIPSLKEIKVEKLMDLIDSGGILNEADR